LSGAVFLAHSDCPPGARLPAERHALATPLRAILRTCTLSMYAGRAVGLDRKSAAIRAPGAATSVWAAFVAPAEEVGGRYCEDCQVSQVTEG
jgi:hypothetical protein